MTDRGDGDLSTMGHMTDKEKLITGHMINKQTVRHRQEQEMIQEDTDVHVFVYHEEPNTKSTEKGILEKPFHFVSGSRRAGLEIEI